MNQEIKQNVIGFAKNFLKSIHIKSSIDQIIIIELEDAVSISVLFNEGDFLSKVKEGYRRRFLSLFEALSIYSRFKQILYQEPENKSANRLSVVIKKEVFYMRFARLQEICEKISTMSVLDFFDEILNNQCVSSVHFNDSERNTYANLTIELDIEEFSQAKLETYYFSIYHTIESTLHFLGLTPMNQDWYIDNQHRVPSTEIVINFKTVQILQRAFSLFRQQFAM